MGKEHTAGGVGSDVPEELEGSRSTGPRLQAGVGETGHTRLTAKGRVALAAPSRTPGGGERSPEAAVIGAASHAESTERGTSLVLG